MTELKATHEAVKNEGVVTHYDIKVNKTLVGTSKKDDKGRFSFTPKSGAGEALKEMKTMRDLKTAVVKGLPKGWKPDPEPAKEKPVKEKKAKAEDLPEVTEEEVAENAATDSEDIDLD